MRPDYSTVGGGRTGNIQIRTHIVGKDGSVAQDGAAETLGKHELERGERNAVVRAAALRGESEAQNNLGVIYENGYGDVRQDVAEATRWYRKSAQQGCAGLSHKGIIDY